MTPPKHVDFEAKRLFGGVGEIIDGSIAYVGLNGGGPTEMHTHEHDHHFIVVKGEAKVLPDKEEAVIRRDEAFLVKGVIPHSVWGSREEETVMIGISVRPAGGSRT